MVRLRIVRLEGKCLVQIADGQVVFALAQVGNAAEMEGLRVAQRLLDQYESLWRGRIDRMTSLIESTKETDA